ncbi:MAG: hypothetical protein AB1486_17455 [Planctomycetota bacterium]
MSALLASVFAFCCSVLEVSTAGETVEASLDLVALQERGLATVTLSGIEYGTRSELFDGLPETTCRTSGTAPGIVLVTFARPMTVTETQLRAAGSQRARWKVEATSADAGSDVWTRIGATTVTSAGSRVVLDTAVAASALRLTVEGADGCDAVDVAEWEILGPVTIETLELEPTTKTLVHPSTWPYRCRGRDPSGLAVDITSNVTWSSSCEDVVVVEPDGLVATTGLGSATVRATLGKLESISRLTVNPPAPPPGNFTAETFYSTAHLTWDAVPGEIAGYVLYRRKENQDYPPEPTAYIGPREDATDFYLWRGETHFWKIAAYDANDNIVSEFAETSGTQLMNDHGMKKKAAPKLLIALYHGEWSDWEADTAEAGIQLVLDWYWRNSLQRFFMDTTWMFIDAPVPDKGDGYSAIEADLRNRGVKDGEYDLVFTTGAGIGPCLGGYVIFHGTARASKGVVCGVPFPGDDAGVNYTVAWTFCHEIHHAIDGLADDGGGDDMLFNHFPWNYPYPLNGQHVDWGPHWDGNARIMRVYDDYLQWTNVDHGDYIEVWDLDDDGMADGDARVPMDEVRFGSSPQLADTDGDGLSDARECDRYVYSSLDPNDPDSDGDGLPDGSDKEPLYKTADTIEYALKPPTIDGRIELGWEKIAQGYFYTRQGWDFALEIFALWDAENLYLAFESEQQLYYKVSVDGSGLDGRFEANVRHVDANYDDKATQYGDSYADGNHIEISPYSSTASVYGVGTIPGSLVRTTYAQGRYQTEARLPRQLPHGCGYTYFDPDTAAVTEGLTLMPGRVIGLNVTMATLGGHEFNGVWTGLFETYGFVDFTLAPPRLGPVGSER